MPPWNSKQNNKEANNSIDITNIHLSSSSSLLENWFLRSCIQTYNESGRREKKWAKKKVENSFYDSIPTTQKKFYVKQINHFSLHVEKNVKQANNDSGNKKIRELEIDSKIDK